MGIVRKLSKELTLYKEKDFPASYKNTLRSPHRAIIGVGGNVGDVRRRFHHLLCFLRRSQGIAILHTAPILKNPPFGYAHQEDFLNTVIEVSTIMSPRVLLDFLLRTEKRFARKRSFPNAPRTLDLDLIFYDQVKMNTPKLTLPHPYYAQRESVIIPLYLLGTL